MDDPAGEHDDPASTLGGWGLIDDPELLAARVEAADERSLVDTLLALVDDAASRVLDHPIRPRVKASPAGLLKGELDVVQVEVPAVLAAGLVLDRLSIRAEHVRIVPGLPPRLQAHPVGLRAYVSQDNVDRWTRSAHLPIRLALTSEGVLLTTGLRGIRMSETLAELEVSGRFLRLAPKRMTIVGLPAPLARFFRGYLPLPPLPKGAHITEVRPSDGELAVTFELEAIDEPLTPDIARRLRQLARFPLPGLG
ncbi:MAG: LmeA family phospholipid-binding protein [Acidimicrobiales bacterium]